jgi:hypothetical protein
MKRNHIPCLLLGAALAAHARGAEPERIPPPPAAYSLPVLDTADRGTPRDQLRPYGLDKVVVKVTGLGLHPPPRIDVLTPDLTPATAFELREAFPECIWKPALGPNGEPVKREVTLLVHAQR